MATFINGVEQGNEGGSSGNVAFPATQVPSADANTLDDYEEGTWTPTIQDDSRSDAEDQAYTAQVGIYTKIGRVVYIECELATSSLGTLTTSENVVIAGLPFTSSSTITNPGLAIGFANGLALPVAQDSLTIFVAANGTIIKLQIWEATDGPNDLILSEWSADGRLSFSGSYTI